MKRVLIMANGPSRHMLPQNRVISQIGADALALINYNALKRFCDFAVAVDQAVVGEFADKKLHEKSGTCVITNREDVVSMNKDWRERVRGL